MLTLPDFNRLKVFSIVYSNKSIVKASQILGITRSAVSQSLKALEDELGTKLFIRDSKKFQPTESGKVLFGTMEPFMGELHSTLQQIERGKREPMGHIRVGAPLDFGSTHLTQIIAEFRKRYPLITFELTLAIPVKQLNLLSDGKLDIAFIDNADVHAQNYPVSLLTVMKESFVLACSKAYFDKKVGKRDFWATIEELNFVDYVHHAPVLQMWMKKHFGKVPPRFPMVYSAESVRAVLTAIYSDMGLGVVPKQLIKDDVKSGKIKVINPSNKELINQIALVRLLGRPVSARERLFLDFYKSKIST